MEPYVDKLLTQMPNKREHFKSRLGICTSVRGIEATFPLTQHFAVGLVAQEIMRWALPFSFATTKGIAFAFFSSAY